MHSPVWCRRRRSRGARRAGTLQWFPLGSGILEDGAWAAGPPMMPRTLVRVFVGPHVPGFRTGFSALPGLQCWIFVG